MNELDIRKTKVMNEWIKREDERRKENMNKGTNWLIKIVNEIKLDYGINEWNKVGMMA